MKTAPSSPLIVAETEFLLQFLVITLDAPAQLGEIHETRKAYGCRQGRKPILGRLVFALRPFDQQPFLRPALGALVIAMRNANPYPSKA